MLRDLFQAVFLLCQMCTWDDHYEARRWLAGGV